MIDDVQFALNSITKKRAKSRRIKENALIATTITQSDRFNAESE
jgi:hypothetical protein